jgi:hypothetical protein
MRSHDLGPGWTPTIREDRGLSQRLHVGPPFRFCPAPSAFAHHGDPTRNLWLMFGVSFFGRRRRSFYRQASSPYSAHPSASTTVLAKGPLCNVKGCITTPAAETLRDLRSTGINTSPLLKETKGRRIKIRRGTLKVTAPSVRKISATLSSPSIATRNAHESSAASSCRTREPSNCAATPPGSRSDAVAVDGGQAVTNAGQRQRVVADSADPRERWFKTGA